MKRILLLVALCGGAFAAPAQVSLGVKGGLTIPNITPSGTNPLSEGYSSFLTGGGGVFAEFQMTEMFSLQVGLEFSQQGGKKNGMQALPVAPIKEQFMAGLGQMGAGLPQGVDQLLGGVFPPNYLYADFDGRAKFNYLLLPVQAKLGWNLSKTSPVRFYVSAGVFGGYLLSAERVSTGRSPFFMDAAGTTSYYDAAYDATLGMVVGQMVDAGMLPQMATAAAAQALEAGGFSNLQSFQYQDNTENITDDIKSFNFGFIASVGFSYQLSERHRIFIEGGGNYGFLKIQKSAENGENRIGAGTVMVGYSFKL